MQAANRRKLLIIPLLLLLGTSLTHCQCKDGNANTEVTEDGVEVVVIQNLGITQLRGCMGGFLNKR